MKFLNPGLGALIASVISDRINANSLPPYHESSSENYGEEIEKRHSPSEGDLKANLNFINEGSVDHEKQSLSGTQDSSIFENAEQNLHKRYLPLHVGLVANPNVLTEDPVRKERRSLDKNFGSLISDNVEQKLEKRYLPLHVGLAANPNVLTEEPAKKERRSVPLDSRNRLSGDAEQKLEKRYFPLHVGLAANPNVLTEDPVKKERRSVPLESQNLVSDHVEQKLEKRYLPLHVGLAANPNVLTEDPAKRERRSLPVSSDTLVSDHVEQRLQKRYLPLHVGLAANPNVLTEDPSSPTKKLRRDLESLESALNEKLESGTQSNFSIDSAPQLTLERGSFDTVPKSKPMLNLNTVGSTRAVSFPLYRRERLESESEIHPDIYFQQHRNNALRRHAKFLNKTIDDSDLVENIKEGAESLNIQYSDLQRRGATLLPRQNDGTASAGYPRSAFASAKSGTVTPSMPVTAANSVGLSIEANDVGYFAEILVGTPASKFRVVVDTGSADLWLMLEECKSIKDQGSCNHPALKSTSSTFKKTTNKFKVTYGTGKVEGVLVEETLNLGGLVLNNHVFGGATAASDEFTGKNVPFDGLLGTAKSVLSNQKVLTPVEALAKAGSLSGAFVGYSIGRVSDSVNIGQVTFGGVDQTKFTGDLTLFPNVNKKGFWEGAMPTVTVDGQTVLTQRTGILDTGTTLILAPKADVQAVHEAIPGAVADKKGNFKIPCTTKARVGLSFGGNTFEINPVDLTFQPIGKNLAGMCVSGISAGNVGGPSQWLIGDVFLKNVYFATDIPNDQIGLAVINRVQPKDAQV